MEKIRVALVQSDIVWENIDKNLELLSDKLSNLHDVDLVVLPEMFATGFTMNVEKNYHTQSESVLAWMQKTAANNKCALYGSVLIKEDAKFFNRAFFVKENSEYEIYKKRHLFTLAGEDKYFTAGNKREIIEYKGWRFLPQICYDLRFPVWSRNNLDYDVAIYVANWPEKRSYAWKSLLKARAIENISYVIGVNRVGKDGNGHIYSGDSALINPMGEVLTNIPAHREMIEIVELDKKQIHKVRNNLGFLKDMDDFSITDIF